MVMDFICDKCDAKLTTEEVVKQGFKVKECTDEQHRGPFTLARRHVVGVEA